jgi:hypothetical protein
VNCQRICEVLKSTCIASDNRLRFSNSLTHAASAGQAFFVFAGPLAGVDSDGELGEGDRQRRSSGPALSGVSTAAQGKDADRGRLKDFSPAVFFSREPRAAPTLSDSRL